MSSMSNLAKEIRKSLSESDRKKPKGYDTEATVSSVDDNVLWVKIPGSETETPVRKTINAKVGDVVMVRVANHRAWTVGNETNPPTDDSVANNAYNVAAGARKAVLALNKIVVENIEATNAKFVNVEADTAKIHDLRADQILASVGYIEDLQTSSIAASDIVSDHADIGTLKTTKADISDLNAANAEIETLKTSKANVTDLNATNAEIETLKTSKANVTDLNAANAEIDNLKANKADVTSLNAEKARIDDLEADHVSTDDLDATNAEITNLKSSKADITDLNAANAKITNLESTKADISVLEAGYAKIDLANVNNAYIKNGVFDTAAIVDEQVFTVTGNKATITEINADEINVRNLNAKNLKIETADGYIQLGDKKTPTKEFIDSLTNELNDRIDGAIETYTSTAVPTLSNYPANAWDTDDEKATHVGDVCYVVNDQIAQNGYCYRFTLSGTTFSWQLIKDSDVTAALQRLQTAEGKIGNIETFDEEIASFKTNTEGELSSLKTKTTNLETSLGDKVDKTTFNEVKQTVDENSASISTLTTTVSKKADSSTVTSLSNTVNTISQKADANEAAISSLNTAVASKADGSTVTSLSNRVNTISQTVDGNSATISALNTTTTNLRNDLDNLEIGGRNLAKNTGVRTPDSSSQVEFVAYKLGVLPIKTNEELTVSFDLRMVIGSAINGSPTLNVYNSNYKGPHGRWLWVANSTSSPILIPKGNYAVGDVIECRCSATITTPNEFDAGGQSEDWIEFYSDYNTENAITISYIKVERGNKATDWTPAPEDVDASVTTLSNTVNNISQTVNENSASISSLDTRVSSKADNSVVTSLNQAVNRISQKADANEAAISSLSETVDEKADGSTVSTLSQTVNSVKQTADGNSSTISKLTTTLGTNADGTTKTGDIVHRTSAIEQDLSGFKSTVSSTYTTKSTFDSYKTSNDSAVAAAKKAGTDAQSDLNSYKTTNNAAVAAAKQAGDNAQASIDNLEIGGKNLLKRTADYDNSAWVAPYPVVGEDNGTIFAKVWHSASSSWIKYLTQYVDFELNQPYTVSFLARKTNTDGVNPRLSIRNDRNDAITFFTPTDGVEIDSDTWKKYTYTISKVHASSANEPFRVYAQYTTVGGNTDKGALSEDSAIQVARLKLEKGNRATDWTPAPEDLEAEAQAVQDDLDAYKTTVSQTYATQSSLTQTESSIRQEVSSTYTSQTTFNNYKTTNDSAVAAAKKAGTDAQSDLNSYKTTNDTAVGLAQKAGNDAQADLNSYKTTNNAAVAAAKKAGTDAQSDINSYKTTNNAAVAAIKTTADSAKEAIDNLEIGGRNILFYKVTQAGRTLNYGDYGIILPCNENLDTYFNLYTREELIEGEQYTLSCDVEGVIDGTQFVFPLFEQNHSGTGYLTINKNGKCTHTFVMDDYKTSTRQVDGQTVYWLFMDDITRTLASGQGAITLKNFKLEKGNRATDWTPAPEDIVNELESVKTNYVTKASWETKNDEIAGQVSAVETTTKSYTDGKISQEVSDRNSAITAKANEITTSVSNTYATKTSLKTTSDNLADYITSNNSALATMQSQIDGAIETWFYTVDPTSSNEPAKNWNTTDLKNIHLGDLYYNTTTGHVFRWQLANSTYSWTEIQDTDARKALADAAKAQATADNKRRVFVAQPTTPYDIGDLWVQGTSGDIMRCSTARASGSYTASDWVKASKYTDDSTFNTFKTTTYDTKIQQLDNQIALTATKTEVTNAVNAVNVGGRNIVLNSNHGWTSTSYNVVQGTLSEDWVPQETYTIQIKGTPSNGAYFGLWRDGGNVCVREKITTKKSGYDDIWIYTFSCPNPREGLTPFNNFSIYDFPSSVTHNAHIDWIKIERGNKATDWSPAPEDLESYADNAVSVAKASIKVTTDAITTEVGKKVGTSEIISKINQSPESITIDANRVNMAGAARFNSYATKTDAQGYATNAKNEAVEAANVINNKAVSRGEQLVTNGNCLLGDNTNFSSWTFSGAVANNSPGSFTRTGGYTNVWSDEFFPVDTNKRYRFEFDMKSRSNVGTMYSMLVFFDVDKQVIYAYNHMYFEGTLTYLTQDLKPGDTVVHFESLANWNVNTSTRTYQRGFKFWNYQNSFGYQYPENTYSRKIYTNLYTDANVNKTNNTITLTSAWPNSYGTIPSGTKVSQNNDGGNYKYGPLVGGKVPTEWTHYVSYMEGVDYSGQNVYQMFPPGTAYCKVGFLWNYNSADDQFWVTNIQVYEDYKTDINKALSIKGYHVLQSNYSQPYNTLKTWAAEGTNAGNWSVTSSLNDVRVGDTVAIKCTNSTDNTALYVILSVTDIPSSTLVKGISHGFLDAGNATDIAKSAKTTADAAAPKTSAVAEEQYIYISKSSGTTSVSGTTSWVTESGDKQNTWTTKRPTYNTSYPVLFVAKQKKVVSGTVTCTTPVKDDTTTVIDGGHITTGTIDAARLNITDIIASGSILISGSNISELNNDSSFATTGNVATAKSEAISAAASDATSKASTAKSEAISAAASDATSKANAAQSAAEKTATNYIYADSSGIKVASSSPSTATRRVQITSSAVSIHNDNNNYANVTSSGLEVVQGGNSVASFGSAARIGSNSGSRVEIGQSNGMNVFDESNKLRINASSTGLSIFDYDGDTRVNVAQFANSARIGRTSSRYITISDSGMDFYGDLNSKIAHIGYGSTTGQSGVQTSSFYVFGTTYDTSRTYGSNSMSEGNGVALGYSSHAEGAGNTSSSAYCAHAECGGTANGQYSHAEGWGTATGNFSHAQGQHTIAGYENQLVMGIYNSNKSNSAFEIGDGTSIAARSNCFRVTKTGDIEAKGGITVNGHNSAIGSILDRYLTASKTVNNNTGTALCGVELPIGVWLLHAWVRFPSNATGSRACNISNTSGAPDWQMSTAAVNGNITQLHLTRLINVTSLSTYYLNVVQTSGSAMTLATGSANGINSLRAVRIA